MRLFLVLVFGLVSLSCPCRAQAYDWARVENLPAGTQLVVSSRRAVACRMIDVEDDGLLCSSAFGGFWIPRTGIDHINLASNKAVAIGRAAGILGGGIAAGVRSGGDPLQTSAAAATGGFLGYLIGHLFAFHAKGRLVYQQP